MGSTCTAPTDHPTTYRSSISPPIWKPRGSRPEKVRGPWPSYPSIERRRGSLERRRGSLSDDEHFLRRDAAREAVLVRARTDDRGIHKLDGLFIAHIVGSRHASIQRVSNVGAGLAFAHRYFDRSAEGPALRRHRGRLQYRAPGQARDPVL